MNVKAELMLMFTACAKLFLFHAQGLYTVVIKASGLSSFHSLFSCHISLSSAQRPHKMHYYAIIEEVG